MSNTKTFFKELKQESKKWLKFIDKVLLNKIVLCVLTVLLSVLSFVMIFNIGATIGRVTSYMDFTSTSETTIVSNTRMDTSTPFRYYSEVKSQTMHIDGDDVYTVDAVNIPGTVVVSRYDENFDEKKSWMLNYVEIGYPVYESFNLDGFTFRYGGFHFGEDYNFLVLTGQDIGEDGDRTAVERANVPTFIKDIFFKKYKHVEAPAYRVIKYNKNMKQLDYVDVAYGTQKNNNISRPLGFSTVAIDENASATEITIHSGKEGFRDNWEGVRHQYGVQLIIDIDTMAVKKGVMTIFVSHSLDQFFKYDGDDRIFVSLADNNPHGITMSKVPENFSNATHKTIITTPVIGGYYLMHMNLGSLVVSESSYLTAYNIMDTSQTVNTSTRNVYISVSSRTSISNTTNILIKSYDGTSYSGGDPHIVPVGNDKYMVIWQEYLLSGGTSYYTTCYMYINGSGDILSSISYDNTLYLNKWAVPEYLEDSNSVVWYADNGTERIFYSVGVDV